MKLRNRSQWKFLSVLGMGAGIAIVLCVQCVRTYLYTDAVLVPQQAEHEAARQAGALTAAARSAGVTDPFALEPLLERAMESASDRVLSMRVLNRDGRVLVERGKAPKTMSLAPQWWERLEKHETVRTEVATPEGQALVVVLPLRLGRPPHPLMDGQPGSPGTTGVAVPNGPPNSPDTRDDRRIPYVLELAISLKAVAGTFAGLRQNLIIGLIASIALLVAVGVIGLRAPHYFRGKYLENELQLARLVQNDLQPKPQSVSPYLEFAASCVAADHVGGDFYDVFEVEPGKVAIVLGDVSGKGIPAALLVSVLHGAIRSATASAHELAVERINRMLCERTACERFATLFWAVFDLERRTLHYVNAGHPAPMLIRRNQAYVERLAEGGPVLGLLPDARYSAGAVEVGDLDTLVLYSDGITEAASENEEFGDARVQHAIAYTVEATPERICSRILSEVASFATNDLPQDDCTLMVVNFRQPELQLEDWKAEGVGIAAA